MGLKTLYLQKGLSLNGRGALLGSALRQQLADLSEHCLTAHAVLTDEAVDNAVANYPEFADQLYGVSRVKDFAPDLIYLEGGLLLSAEGGWRIPAELAEQLVTNGAVMIVADADTAALKQSRSDYCDAAHFFRAQADYGREGDDTVLYGADHSNHWQSDLQVICRPDRMVISEWLRPVYNGVQEIVVGRPACLNVWDNTLASGNPGTTGTLRNDEWVEYPGNCASACSFASVRKLGDGYVALIAGNVSGDTWANCRPGNLQWLKNVAMFLTEAAAVNHRNAAQSQVEPIASDHTLAVAATADSVAPDSEWKDFYHRYRRLQREWRMEDVPPEVERQFFDQVVVSPRELNKTLAEAKSWGVNLPVGEIWDEALALRQAIAQVKGGRDSGDPMADVYQAALSMCMGKTWIPSEDLAQLYRGQRDCRWPVVSTLFRRQPTKNQVEHELERLRKVVRTLQSRKPDLTDEQAVAVAQHYSAEAGVKTWLLDVTWDPFVALYFASLGGQEGDIGVVSYLAREEWERFSVSGENRLGAIRVIEVPNVHRIEAQRALFVDTSHPDFFEQYVPHSIWFHQQPGLIFEDPDANPPITSAELLPVKEPIIEMIRVESQIGDATPLSVAPVANSADFLTKWDYLKLVESWSGVQGWRFEGFDRNVLIGICDFHARLQRQRERIGVGLRSLHRLWDAVKFLHQWRETAYARVHTTADTYGAMREVMGRTLSRSMSVEERELLEQLADEIDRNL